MWHFALLHLSRALFVNWVPTLKLFFGCSGLGPISLWILLILSLPFSSITFFLSLSILSIVGGFSSFNNGSVCPPHVLVWWHSLLVFSFSWLLPRLISLYLLPLLFLISVLFSIYSVLLFHGFHFSPHWGALVNCLWICFYSCLSLSLLPSCSWNI